MEKYIALSIVSQMSDDDLATFDPDQWREGVGHLLIEEWAGADLDEVIEEMNYEIPLGYEHG